MFLHLSVSHSVHRGGGGGLCPSMHHHHLCLEGLCPGDLSDLSGGVSVWGSLCRESLSRGGSLSRGSVSRGGLSREGLCPGGLCPVGLCLGVSVQGGLCPCLGGSVYGVSVQGVSIRATPLERDPPG